MFLFPCHCAFQLTDLVPGDCGSWLLDHSMTCFIGMLVATSPIFGLAYIVPAQEIMADFYAAFREQIVSLPSHRKLRKLTQQASSSNQDATSQQHHENTSTRDDTTEKSSETAGAALSSYGSWSPQTHLKVYIVQGEKRARVDSIHLDSLTAHDR